MRTIVLIHGAWMNHESWAPWIVRYEARGYKVIAPSWPYDDRPVAELRSAPNPELAGLGAAQIVDHYEKIIRALPEPPILIGHSFGGLWTQILLDRGLGVAGVAIDSAPPKGVLPAWNAIKAGFPVVSAFRFATKVFHMSLEDWRWGWTHTLSPAEQEATFEKFPIPTPGRVYWDGLVAPFTSTLAVNFQNDTRAPLLLLAGTEDRTVPASMNRANFAMYARSKAVTDFNEFPGRTHWIIAQPGWEEVGDFALEWVEKHLPA
jgi:pimeloyl-ACP methyl ester carboxylesterase